MPKDDLFAWINALWTKKVLEGTPPMYVAHRFLASDRDMAQLARELQQQVRDPMLMFRVWQGALPKGQGAPRLQYVAAKKPPAEEELVARIRTVLAERREVVEEMIAVVQQVGRVRELYTEYGIAPPEDTKKGAGLLA